MEEQADIIYQNLERKKERKTDYAIIILQCNKFIFVYNLSLLLLLLLLLFCCWSLASSNNNDDDDAI